ncbi:MAG TPA: histidine kinase [Verrucomicrobiae bacterium]
MKTAEALGHRARHDRMKPSLIRRTAELAASNRQLQQGVLQRKLMADDFAQRGRHRQKSLEESLARQKRLRQWTHGVLAAQEDERKSISHELHDEIAQTLLGVQVRLLTLKTAAHGKAGNLTKEIASAQRLVVASLQSVNRFARELGAPGKCRRPVANVPPGRIALE